MPWWIACAVAVAGCTALEYANRRGGFAHFGDALWRTWFLILFAQGGLFYLWRGAPSFLVAAAVFNVGMATARCVSVWVSGERLTPYHVLGVAVMVAGMLIIKAAPR